MVEPYASSQHVTERARLECLRIAFMADALDRCPEKTRPRVIVDPYAWVDRWQRQIRSRQWQTIGQEVLRNAREQRRHIGPNQTLFNDPLLKFSHYCEAA